MKQIQKRKKTKTMKSTVEDSDDSVNYRKGLVQTCPCKMREFKFLIYNLKWNTLISRTPKLMRIKFI